MADRSDVKLPRPELSYQWPLGPQVALFPGGYSDSAWGTRGMDWVYDAEPNLQVTVNERWTAPRTPNQEIVRQMITYVGTTTDYRQCQNLYAESTKPTTIFYSRKDALAQNTQSAQSVDIIDLFRSTTAHEGFLELPLPGQTAQTEGIHVVAHSRPASSATVDPYFMNWMPPADTAGGWVCAWTEARTTIPQGSEYYRYFSPLMDPPVIQKSIRTSLITPSTPRLTDPNATFVAGSGGAVTFEISLANYNVNTSDHDSFAVTESWGQRLEGRSYVYSVADRPTAFGLRCDSVAGSSSRPVPNLRPGTYSLTLNDESMGGKYFCLQQTVKTNWMQAERLSVPLIIPLESPVRLITPTIRVTSAFANLYSAVNLARTLQTTPGISQEQLDAAAEALQEARQEAERLRAENPDVEIELPVPDQTGQGGLAATPEQVEKELTQLGKELEKDLLQRKQQEASPYVALSSKLKKALKTGDALLVSTKGRAQFEGMDLTIKAPTSHKRGAKKKYTAILDPGMTGTIGYALVRANDKGQEVIALKKVSRTAKNGKKTISWLMPRKAVKGGYTLYVSFKPDAKYNRSPFTVAKVVQVK